MRFVELWLIRGLADVSMLGELPDLRYLFLQALKRVERLPAFDASIKLRRIHLETMRGIRDLRPLATARSVNEILLIDMPQLRPADLSPLLELPALRAVSAGLGNHRQNQEARELLKLPSVEWSARWRPRKWPRREHGTSPG